MIDGVVGVIIWTDNLERLAQFYETVLGLTPHSRHSDFISFRWGNMRLGLGLHSFVHGTARDPYRIMVNLGTGDIHATVERLREQGVKILRPPEQEKWRGWVATFEDPDGNILQLLQQPPAREGQG